MRSSASRMEPPLRGKVSQSPRPTILRATSSAAWAAPSSARRSWNARWSRPKTSSAGASRNTSEPRRPGQIASRGSGRRYVRQGARPFVVTHLRCAPPRSTPSFVSAPGPATWRSPAPVCDPPDHRGPQQVIRRTRIVCTIGPSSSSPSILRTMVQSGMDVARLNFSHGDHATHGGAAENVRAAAESVGRPVALLVDLQGPKIRTGPLDSSFMRLARGRMVALVGGPRSGADEIEVSHPELVDALRPGDRVLIDDGRIELVVRSVSKGRAECSVVRGGLLGERKGVSGPGRPLPLPALTDKDLEDLKFAVQLGVDYIALSFVRRPEDLLVCQQHLNAAGCKAPVIPKLENPQPIRNLDKILEVAD